MVIIVLRILSVSWKVTRKMCISDDPFKGRVRIHRDDDETVVITMDSAIVGIGMQEAEAVVVDGEDVLDMKGFYCATDKVEISAEEGFLHAMYIAIDDFRVNDVDGVKCCEGCNCA